MDLPGLASSGSAKLAPADPGHAEPDGKTAAETMQNIWNASGSAQIASESPCMVLVLSLSTSMVKRSEGRFCGKQSTVVYIVVDNGKRKSPPERGAWLN